MKRNYAPIIGKKVILMPNVIISGSSVVGDNVVVSKSIVRVLGGSASDAALHFVLLSSFSVIVFHRK